MCHVIFKCVHQVENSTKYRADELCLKLGVRIFLLNARWPPLFFQQIISFCDSFHCTKKQKNLYVGSFNYFSYTIHSLELVHEYSCAWLRNCIFLRLIPPDLMTCSKGLSNRPIYSVLNTHNFDMILQLKYTLRVMNPARIASSDWKS